MKEEVEALIMSTLQRMKLEVRESKSSSFSEIPSLSDVGSQVLANAENADFLPKNIPPDVNWDNALWNELATANPPLPETETKNRPCVQTKITQLIRSSPNHSISAS